MGSQVKTRTHSFGRDLSRPEPSAHPIKARFDLVRPDVRPGLGARFPPRLCPLFYLSDSTREYITSPDLLRFRSLPSPPSPRRHPATASANFDAAPDLHRHPHTLPPRRPCHIPCRLPRPPPDRLSPSGPRRATLHPLRLRVCMGRAQRMRRVFIGASNVHSTRSPLLASHVPARSTTALDRPQVSNAGPMGDGGGLPGFAT